MKIVFFVHQFYPKFYTGTERFILNLARYMQGWGHKVRVVTYDHESGVRYKKSINGVFSREYIYQGVPVIAFRTKTIVPQVSTDISEKNKLALFAEQVLEKKKPDILHFGHFLGVSEFANTAIKLKIPYVVTLTDFNLICPHVIMLDSFGNLCNGPVIGNKGFVRCGKKCSNSSRIEFIRMSGFANDVLYNAKKVVAPSRFLANIFRKQFKGLKVEVIGYSVNVDKVKENKRVYHKNSHLNFGYIGSLSYRKGVYLLLNAFKAIESDRIRLYLCGSGENQLYLRKLKSIAKFDKRISFKGVVSEAEVILALSKTDVLFIPSLWHENNPMIMNEAFASKVPVVASNVGGLSEKIRHSFNGFLFERGSEKSLKEVIKKIATNPALLNRIKKNISDDLVAFPDQEAYAYNRIYTG